MKVNMNCNIQNTTMSFGNFKRNLCTYIHERVVVDAFKEAEPYLENLGKIAGKHGVRLTATNIDDTFAKRGFRFIAETINKEVEAHKDTKNVFRGLLSISNSHLINLERPLAGLLKYLKNRKAKVVKVFSNLNIKNSTREVIIKKGGETELHSGFSSRAIKLAAKDAFIEHINKPRHQAYMRLTKMNEMV